MMGWQWHQLDDMQIICTTLQTDNHTITSSLNFYGRMLLLTPNQQRQSTEGKTTTTPLDNDRLHIASSSLDEYYLMICAMYALD